MLPMLGQASGAQGGCPMMVRSVVAVLAAALLLTPGCARHGGLELTPGGPVGRDIAGLVDSEPARRLLVDLLERRSADPRFALRAPNLVDADLGSGLDRVQPTDAARLRELARQVSVDFAALAFARAVSADARSREVQAAFEHFLRNGATRSEEVLKMPGAFPYTVLFAPAWLYLSHPETGSDFADQRRVLDQLGIANRLIATGESASVEGNAEVIAAAVRATGPEGAGLILVSVSKSGAEVALALSRLLAPEEAASVVAWVNVAGALRGSPLADSALRPPASWITRFVFWFSGWDWAGMTSMATERSRQRLEGARLPASIAVVNVVAVPVSGTVSLTVRPGYEILKRYGPNDGVVLLADTVWPGGVNVISLGSDHLFTPRRDDVHTVALLQAVDVALRLHTTEPRPGITVGGSGRGQTAEGSSGGGLDPR